MVSGATEWPCVLLAVLGLGCLALPGCDLWREQRLVHLPELPPAWRHFEVVLQLTLVDGRDGREQRLRAARPGATLALPVGRSAASVIVARPLVTGPVTQGGADTVAGNGNGRLLRPAGAVVAVSETRSGALEVTWERGLLAGLVLDLWRGGAKPWLLNLERLDRELAARAAGDPWSLDREAVLAALAADAMSSAAIRRLPQHGVELQLPAGRWVWWNPFAPPLLSDGRSRLTLAVAGGYHLLLGDDGRALALQAHGAEVLISAAAPRFGRRPP